MKLSPTEQESLVALLARIYDDIYAIEEEFQLLAGDHDFRPRIDYFHDAIRAFTSENPNEREKGGRLSVEMLAYDVACLRYIQSMPLAPFRPHGEGLSPNAEVVAVTPGLMAKGKRPDRVVREKISELYQHYAVLFSALLKPFADRDYKDRVDALNQDVQDMHDLRQQIEALTNGKGNLATVAATAQHVEEEELRQLLLTFLQQQKYHKKEDVKKLTNFLQTHSGRKDKEIAVLDTAHMNYALAQLGIFESSKDMLKKMAGQGLNLVGKFVEASVAETRRQVGR